MGFQKEVMRIAWHIIRNTPGTWDIGSAMKKAWEIVLKRESDIGE